MKIKFLTVLGLAAAIGATGACRSSSNTNAVLNTNTNVAATVTPVAKTTESATVDPNLKASIEKALKDKGFTGVTIDTSTPKMTARGTVAKGKMAEMMAVITQANGGKPVDNQVTEK